MMWEGKGIGAIWVAREHAGPFSDKEIALLKTFADQAVIAIQNARLVNETKEALEQQRASSEVLSAISSSIADSTRCSTGSWRVASQTVRRQERRHRSGREMTAWLNDLAVPRPATPEALPR